MGGTRTRLACDPVPCVPAQPGRYPRGRGHGDDGAVARGGGARRADAGTRRSVGEPAPQRHDAVGTGGASGRGVCRGAGCGRSRGRSGAKSGSTGYRVHPATSKQSSGQCRAGGGDAYRGRDAPRPGAPGRQRARPGWTARGCRRGRGGRCRGPAAGLAPAEGSEDQEPGQRHRLRHSAAAREGRVAHSESARVIALVNQKGGCAKTTTAVNLAACLASSGRRTLVIDLDPQANATASLGVDPGGLTRTVYHVLVGDERDDAGATLAQTIVPTTLSNLFSAPSSIDLAAAELELAARIGRENSLRKRMGPVLTEYAYIFIDTPPSLGLLTLNALVASDEIIIPIQTHYYALLGMRQVLRTLKMVREEVGHQVEILGVLPTMYDSRTNISKEIVQGIKDFFGDKVFDTAVHFNIKLVESSMVGVPLFMHDPSSRGAQEYMELAKEVMKGHEERARGAAARH